MSSEATQVHEQGAGYSTTDEIQEVPSGYKRTDAGVIPIDWGSDILGNVLKKPVQNGVFNAPGKKGHGIKLINVINLYHAIPILLESLELFDATATEIKSYSVSHGDIFFTRSSLTPEGIAHCNVYSRDTSDPIVFDCHLIRACPDRSKVDGFFLFRYCTSSIARKYLVASAKTTTMTTVDQSVITRLPIPIPDIPEQRAIAEALSDVDGLLGALAALIAKKRAIKQAAMQQLLTGKTRLPGFSGEWETKRLGEIASIRNQKVVPSHVDADTLCVELEHIGQGNGCLLGSSTAANTMSSKYRFFAGDVLFGRLRSYLHKFWLADMDGICTTEIWPLMVQPDQADRGFLFAIVQSDRFIDAASISYGTHMPRADWSVMRSLEVRLPNVQEQTAIAAVLSDMDAEIVALERRRDKTKQIKQGMMQQLLTGRVRLVKSAVGS